MRDSKSVRFSYLWAHWDSLASIGIRFAAVALGFLVSVAIGQKLGAVAVGQYGIVTQTGMLASIVCVGGLDLSLIRGFAGDREKDRDPATRSFLKVCALVVALMIFASFLLWISTKYINDSNLDFYSTDLVFATIIAILFARGFTRITSSFLRSQGEYIFSQIVEGPLIPALILLAIIVGLAADLDAVFVVTAVAGLFACLLGMVSSVRRTSRDGIEVPLRPLIRRAVPLWGVAISKNLGDWYSLAIVAAMLSLYDAGVFRVVMQVASALPIITIGIFSVYSPKIGLAHAREDYLEIARLARTATALSTFLVLPPAILIIVLAEPVLSLFGGEFTGGAFVLQVLLVGQMLYVCTGPSGLVLAMTGNEKVNLLLTVSSLIALLIGLPLAAQYFGLLGVVIAMSLVLILRNFASLIAVHRLTGVRILSGRFEPVTAKKAVT